jgi:hypothetical protein
MKIMTDKPFYEELKLLKENGEELNFEDITYNELKTLWWEENICDSLIGDLYGVSKRTVNNKRKKLSLIQAEMLLKEGIEKFILN